MRRFRNILVLCDDDRIAHSAFDRVASLARANAARVTLVDVIDADPGELSRLYSDLSEVQGCTVEADIRMAHRTRLERLAQVLGEQGVDADIAVDTGKPFIEVIRRVQRNAHDLVVKTAHASASSPLLISADMHLLRKCPCPVWVLNSRLEARARRILAAVDPDPQNPVRDKLNHTILELATSLAAQDDARLDVMTVWSLPEENTLRHSLAKVPITDLEAILRRQEYDSDKRFRTLTNEFARFSDRMRLLHIKGNATDLLPEHAQTEEIDTLVMGTVARTGMAGFFIGNTAETVLSRVKCSVLTVKPEGFVTPVTVE